MIDSQTTPQVLAHLLGTTYRNLTFVLYGIGVENLYDTFPIAKKNGGTRTIRSPAHVLKHLQRQLKDYLEILYKPHSAASAFLGGRGIIYNARPHVRKAAIFNIDLEAFYDQMHFGRIRGLLAAPPYSFRPETAQIIAHMCCVDGVLPQGAPTSPILSNMLCRRLDRELSLLAKENRAHYSRYADDITFSFRKDSGNSIYLETGVIVLPSEGLLKIISDNGFTVNPTKTRLQRSSERQVVTGLKVNAKINLDRRYIRTTRAMIHSLHKGVTGAQEKYIELHPDSTSSFQNVVHGRINFIGMVKGKDSDVFQTLAKKFNGLPLNLKVRTVPKTRNLKLESKLHFSSYEEKSRLEDCVWVVDFDGIKHEGVDELIQGTAFTIKGQRIITAAHLFAKANNPHSCHLFSVKDPSKRYEAEIEWICHTRDIAVLKFKEEQKQKFSYLEVAPPSVVINSGYKLSLIGFPQYRSGHHSVAIIPCNVINTFIRSTFRFCDIDQNILGGNSGGPIVNVYMQVVGVALLGQSVTKDGDDVHIQGSNSFICTSAFPAMLTEDSEK